MSPALRRLLVPLLTCLAGILLVPSTSIGDPSEPLLLITPEEADQPINTTVARRGPLDAGPAIRIEKPMDIGPHSGPVSIHVVFEPGKNGLPVDMSSLKLEYQRAWGIDITSRVRDYIEGQEIRIAEASLPAGRHSVEISIEDTSENLSAQVITIVVDD
jgi:hypothetical protein